MQQFQLTQILSFLTLDGLAYCIGQKSITGGESLTEPRVFVLSMVLVRALQYPQWTVYERLLRPSMGMECDAIDFSGWTYGLPAADNLNIVCPCG